VEGIDKVVLKVLFAGGEKQGFVDGWEIWRER
jgi:hypothetical protein